MRPAGDLTADLRPLIENQNPELRAAALKLAGVWKLETFHATAETTALDTNATDILRRAAVEALAAFGGDASRKIVSGLAGDGATSVSSAAIAALCSFDFAEAAAQAAAWFSSPSPLGGERAGVRGSVEINEIFSAFLQRQGGAAALANALAAKAPAEIRGRNRPAPDERQRTT